MARLPSMTALLGLLAVAGYQNRDKIAEMLRGYGQGATGTGQTPGTALPPGSAKTQQDGLGSVLGPIGAGGLGGLLGGGLKELIDNFTQNGHGTTADSWVKTGPNQPVTPQDLEGAIGDDVLTTLTQQTGLSREELLARLSRTLPDAVDRYTPDARIPL